MAYQGPAYGLSRDCMIKAQAKFDLNQANVALDWIKDVTNLDLDPPESEKGIRDQFDFANVLKDGTALCTTGFDFKRKVTSHFMSYFRIGSSSGEGKEKLLFSAVISGYSLKEGKLINKLCPGAVSKINTMKAPFKERENLEMFLKGCELYGLKRHDLFQVNDLYEKKNLYTVVNCMFALGGMAKKKGYEGATIGVKVADENKRLFSKEKLEMGKTIIGLQSGYNQGASQRGMTPYGATRQILPDGK